MLKLVLILVVLCVCNGLKLPGKSPPLRCRDPPPRDEYQLNFDSILSHSSLSQHQALSLFNRPTSVGSETYLAKLALAGATGDIISNPSTLSCPTLSDGTEGIQSVCPHQNQQLASFYNGVYCYVLYPSYQQKYFTKCLCRSCRTGYNSIQNNRRNYCSARNDVTNITNVWAICNYNNTWKIRNTTVPLPQGGCECLSYRVRC